MNGTALAIALAAAGLWWGGHAIAHGTKKAAGAIEHHVLRPIGCGVKTAATLGQKHCSKKK